MVIKKLFLAGLSCGFLSSLQASTLDIYQDKSIYSYKNNKTYLGFNENIKVLCDDKETLFFMDQICPEDEHLCKASQEINALSRQSKEIENTLAVIDTLITNMKLSDFKSSEILEQSKKIAKENASLSLQYDTLNAKISKESNIFLQQAPSMKSANLQEICKGTLKLEFSASEIGFKNSYEAEIIDKKNIRIRHFLTLFNKSGVDIQADKAKLYYRDSQEYVHQREFYPWIISKSEEIRASLKKAELPAPMMMSKAELSDSLEPAVAIQRTDEREYMIEKLNLPASPKAKTHEVMSQKMSADCGLSAYSYMQEGAFYVCSFEPKVQIETNDMIVKKGDEILNASARGEYRDGKYKLFISRDRDIKISRKPIVTKDDESGIFGGDIKKKDGYELTLLNASSKPKEINVIERIPVSTTHDIKVKLISIEGVSKSQYTLEENGRIDFNLTLKPNEKIAIKVLFELTYDKDISVNY
ncbi:MAG: DUF4139 domain-containing protein [Campylobacterales bacterium]|nr:DUF4139 domain-containing protein [Campylobacterales bacterium]